MKRIFLSLICILFAAGMQAQTRYTVPVRSVEQKHQNLVFQFWMAGFGGGINFAKAHGTTPFEYGAYLGKMFAPGWGDPGNFDGLVNGWLRNIEDTRVSSDPPLAVKENNDGSVSITSGEQILHQYVPDGNGIVSFTDLLEFMRGIFTEIGDYLGAKVNIENRDGLLIYTFMKK